MKIKGFTLIEILVAVALFGIAGTLAAYIMVDVVRLEKRSELHNAIYRDAAVLMQQIVDEVKKGTIDYEEYYSIHVVQRGNNEDDVFHGLNHGVYASRFYDPGDSLYHSEPRNPDHLGVECSEWSSEDPTKCDFIFSPSFDFNTGQNPYRGNPERMSAAEANAFCDGRISVGNNCSDMENKSVEELYLIDKSGTRKTVIAAQDFPVDGVGTNERLGIVKMTGIDFDQNGIVDIFSCDPGFDCTGMADGGELTSYRIPYPSSPAFDGADDLISLPRQNDHSAFVPLSPSRAKVESLDFIIRPLEDPYRAYAERDMQQHPSVTIILTLGLSDAAARDYPGEFESVTVQTTVSAGSRKRIDSYPPVTEFREENEMSWIRELL